MRKKDVVLMATVTSFDSLQHPTKSQLRQFAELFLPLFQASTDDAKRNAVASLSQCDHVPSAVAMFIASQPIGICATFLTSSPSLDDQTLITIARTQGSAHAKAIVRRESLSPTVIDALVGLRHARPRAAQETIEAMPLQAALAAIKETMVATFAPQVADRITTSELQAIPEPTAAPAVEPVVEAIAHARPGEAEIKAESARITREEVLRQQIKQLARHLGRPESDRLGVRTVSPTQEALLVRFARNREAGHFATTLADTLSASRWLAERIMLDTSGLQLATTLTGLGTEAADAVVILQKLYPHLAETAHGGSGAARLLASLDWRDCENRVEAWRRADSYTYQTPQQAPMHAPAPDARPLATLEAAANLQNGNVAVFGAATLAGAAPVTAPRVETGLAAKDMPIVTTGTRRVPLYMAGRGRG